MQHTDNYNMKLPDGTDSYSVEHMNGNTNIIDEEMKRLSDGLGNLAGTTVTGTLAIGETSLTLTDDAITTDSTLDFYTDVFGVGPKAVTVSNGSMTLTFKAQTELVTVKVVIK